MRLRKLARLCIHDQMGEHFILPTIWSKEKTAENWCPGGEFLAEDTLVDVDRDELRRVLDDVEYLAEQGNSVSPSYRDRTLLALAEVAEKYLRFLDALAVREGEG